MNDKKELINFSELKRKKLSDMDARKVVESDFTGITEQDKNDIMDACLIARMTIDSNIIIPALSLKERKRLMAQASRFNELYEQLNK